jgi:competence protein ComEA
MTGLTEAERRGARLLALLLLLGTAHDLWLAHHPRMLPEVAARAQPGGLTQQPPAGPSATGTGEPAASPARALDLNTATAAELDRLPGIGPVLAARIVEHRRRNGPFRSADELLTVPGIGPRLLERLRPALAESPRRTP